MRFYAVEPPRGEDQGDGEDTRLWFTRKSDAERCFKALLADRASYEGLYAEERCICDIDDKRAEQLREEMYQCETCDWAHDLITLDEYEIPTDKDGLLRGLKSGFDCYRTQLDCRPK